MSEADDPCVYPRIFSLFFSDGKLTAFRPTDFLLFPHPSPLLHQRQ